MGSFDLGETGSKARGLARAAVVLAGGMVLGACVTDGRTAAPAAPPPVVETAAVSDDEAISGSARIDRLIASAAAENGVPTALAFAVVRVESGYNPKAKGRGVYGLSQIMPATARSLGFSGSASDLYDPETNLKYGMKYLAGAWEKGGHDVCRASMKYKAGHRATHMSRSTLRYCDAVKKHMAEVKRRRMPEALRAQTAASGRAAGQEPARAVLAGLGRDAAALPKPAEAAATAAALPGVEVEAPAPADAASEQAAGTDGQTLASASQAGAAGRPASNAAGKPEGAAAGPEAGSAPESAAGDAAE